MSKPNKIVINGENSCDVVKDYSSSDANVNMGAAIKDISCSEHLDSFELKENKSVIPYPLEFDHLYASNMSDSEKLTDKDSEVMHLKELLLLHLDLIQQQSEQLVTKDKQISDLKLENDKVSKLCVKNPLNVISVSLRDRPRSSFTTSQFALWKKIQIVILNQGSIIINLI